MVGSLLGGLTSVGGAEAQESGKNGKDGELHVGSSLESGGRSW